MDQAEAIKRITAILLAIPEGERRDVIAEVQSNDIFCWHCGYGTVENPNLHCQCWNDE